MASLRPVRVTKNLHCQTRYQNDILLWQSRFQTAACKGMELSPFKRESSWNNFAIVTDRFRRQWLGKLRLYYGRARCCFGSQDRRPSSGAFDVSPPPHRASANLDNPRTQAHTVSSALWSRLSVTKPVLQWRHRYTVIPKWVWGQCPSVVLFELSVGEMEDKPYSVDSSDDINIEEEDEHIETNHSKCCIDFFVCKW